MRGAVEHIIGRGEHQVSGEVGLTPRAKKVIEVAVFEARDLGHKYIGTEHLLLGLIREGDGIAAGVLETFGVKLERVRDVTLRLLAGAIGGVQSAGEPALASPPVESANLVALDQRALICNICGARFPLYFRFCFHCGSQDHTEMPAGEDAGE